MNHDFFEQLGIPQLNVNLEAGGGTLAEQTANNGTLEKGLLDNPANLGLVVADVAYIMAYSIVAKNLHTKVAHVEAGIRSRDITMPDEVNYFVTNSITDYHSLPLK